MFLVVEVIHGLRKRLSRFLFERSAVRNRQYPNRQNTLFVIIIILVTIPILLIVTVSILIATALKRERLQLKILAVDNEFAPVVELMELLRATANPAKSWWYILILSRHRHETIDSLYEEALECRIIRGHGFARILQQSLLLQPSLLVSKTILSGSRSFLLPKQALQVSESLVALRKKRLAMIGLSQEKYVAMAVYSLQYDEERDPREAAKHAMLESDGNDLVAGIDYLQQSGIGVVMLGSEDTKKSLVPRPIPRLCQFGQLGGADEVALASGCDYFWNDSDVGAWWLSLPFRRPILTTNKPRIRLKTNFSGYEHLVVPIRYCRPDGSSLTFRELLSMKSAPFKAASRGELIMIRNSPDEIIEAHIEMRARSSGLWKDDTRTKILRERCQKVFSEFPGNFPMNISSYFLHRHSYLLD